MISVEPNPEFCKAHRKKGYEVLQYACGDHDEDDVDFLVVDSHQKKYGKQGKISYESFSSLGIKDVYKEFKPNLDTTTIKVNLRRLDTMLRDHAADVEHIDVLSIDVEGWELEVIAGLDLARYQPSVMIIENLFDEEKYRTHIADLGYRLWQTIEPNEVYLRSGFGESAVPPTRAED